jgi:ribose transport system permease protein
MTAQLSGQGWNFVAVVALTLGLALVFGAANGYVAHRFDVPPLIVTLGTGAALAGGVLVWTQGNFTGAAPGWLSRFVSPAQSTFGLPVPPVVVFWLVFAIVIIIILHRTPIGMRFYATGSNQTAADLSLVATRRIWLGGYAASAVCAAMAGMLLAGFSGQGLYNIGDPYLFLTVAAVVVGGTSLLGARGDYARTILGVLILIQLSTLLVSRGPAFTRIVTGVAILAVVTIYGREPHVRLRI